MTAIAAGPAPAPITTATPSTDRIQLEPGVHEMPFAEYVRVDAVNWHTLEPMRISAKHARAKLLAPDDATSPLVTGLALHCATYEPERFEEEYVAMPLFEGHPNSNAHKAAKADWLLDNRKKVCLTADEMATMLAMGRAVRDDPVASRFITGKGKNEFVIVWRDKETGLLCKGRVDRLSRVESVVLNPTARADAMTLVMQDLKSTRFITLDGFDGEAGKFGYHGQLAYYHDGLQTIEPAPMTVVIISVENKSPFDVAVRPLDVTELEDGRHLYRRLLNTYAECKKTGIWPGVAQRPVPLVLRKYHLEPESF